MCKYLNSCITLLLLHNKPSQTQNLKTIPIYYFIGSLDQEFRHSLSESYAKGLCQVAIQVLVGDGAHQSLKWGKNHSRFPQVIRIHLLALLGLRFLFLAGYCSETDLS